MKLKSCWSIHGAHFQNFLNRNANSLFIMSLAIQSTHAYQIEFCALQNCFAWVISCLLGVYLQEEIGNWKEMMKISFLCNLFKTVCEWNAQII